MKILKTLFAVFLLLSIFCATPAMAQVSNAQSVPDETTVNMGPSGTFTITWVVDRNQNGATSVDLRSVPGRFRVNGVTVATSPTTRRVFPGDPKTMRVVETVRVPQLVMRRALQLAQGLFEYERDFDDVPPFNAGVTANVTVRTTGGMGGPVSVSRIELMFGNGSTFATVPREALLTAKAVINSSGSGRLDAVWEVSDANPDGSAFYRPIRNVTRTLSAQQRITIESPALPTKTDGRVNVRFRIKEPLNAVQPPVITYFVTGKQGERGFGKLQTMGPAGEQPVAGNTTFEWKPVKGAVAYRLQVLDASSSVIASQLVRGEQSPLSAFVLGQLQAPASYRWRVVAIGEDGNALASSETRSFRLKSR